MFNDSEKYIPVGAVSLSNGDYPMFVIPLFSNGTSHFNQVINEDFNIDYFEFYHIDLDNVRILPIDHENLQVYKRYVSSKIPLYAYKKPDGGIYYGNREELCNYFSKNEKLLRNFQFSWLIAAKFMGRRSLIVSAALNACKSISKNNRNMSIHWADSSFLDYNIDAGRMQAVVSGSIYQSALQFQRQSKRLFKASSASRYNILTCHSQNSLSDLVPLLLNERNLNNIKNNLCGYNAKNSSGGYFDWQEPCFQLISYSGAKRSDIKKTIDSIKHFEPGRNIACDAIVSDFKDLLLRLDDELTLRLEKIKEMAKQDKKKEKRNLYINTTILMFSIVLMSRLNEEINNATLSDGRNEILMRGRNAAIRWIVYSLQVFKGDINGDIKEQDEFSNLETT